MLGACVVLQCTQRIGESLARAEAERVAAEAAAAAESDVETDLGEQTPDKKISPDLELLR